MWRTSCSLSSRLPLDEVRAIVLNLFSTSFRALLRRPSPAATPVLTLALGIGVAIAIFSVVHGVLLKPLPYPDSGRMVRLYHLAADGSRSTLSDPDFADLRERSRSFAALAQFGSGTVSVAGGQQPVRLVRALVSEGFFDLAGVAPAMGRGFDAAEWALQAAPAVLVSERYWRDQLAANPGLDTLKLRIDEREHAVIGVMPAGFDFPRQADLWLPLVASGSSRTAHNWTAAGRLHAGIDGSQAQAELSTLASQLPAEHGEDSTLAAVAVVSLQDDMVGALRPLLLGLLVAALLLHLTALANVGGLLLARLAGRRKEFAIRSALGAGTRRLGLQVLAEASLVVGLGSLLGLLLGALALELLSLMRPGNLPRIEEVAMDARALAFLLLLAAASAAFLAVLVGGQAARAGFSADANRRDGALRPRLLAARGLVVGQVGLAIVLLVGVALLGRSFHGLLQVDPGFRGDGVLAVRIALPWPSSEAERQRQSQFREELRLGMNALPGVVSVGMTNLLPIADGRWNGSFLELARADEVHDFDSFATIARLPGRSGNAEYRQISEGYVQTLGIPLLAGRDFEAGDRIDGLHAALVSEGLARRRWPGEDPVGKLLQFGNMDGNLRPMTVVGVVGDVRESGLEHEASDTIYALLRQRASGLQNLSYVLRTHGEPTALQEQLRQLLAARAPDLPPVFVPFREVLASSLAQRRFALALVGAFALCTLLLAMAAVHAAVSLRVSQRVTEIGVRMALGASARGVVRMILTEGLWLVGLGMLLGAIFAASSARLASSLVHGIGTFDPIAWGLAIAALGASGLLAAWVPARHAARIDPASCLQAG